MEPTEVLSRIFNRHRLLVFMMVLLGLGTGLGLHWNDGPTYQGTARLLATASDPTSSGQATAVADTVRGLATGQALVRRALASIGVHRDPVQVATYAITVQSLGSSGVVQLQVTDHDPKVALQLTNAVARAVVQERSDAASSGLRSQITALQDRIDGVEAEVATVDQKLSVVSKQAGTVDPAVASEASAERAQLLAQRTGLTEELGVYTRSKTDLEGQLAGEPQAAVVDTAQAPAVEVTPRQLPDVALGGLLGLVLGVALAGALETLRPTVMGRIAIARSLQSPVLGEVRRYASDWNRADVLETASHIGLAATGAEVRRVDFMSISEQVDVAGLAAAVGKELTNLTVEVADRDTIVARLVSDGDGSSSLQGNRGRRAGSVRGLVLVVPEAVKLADLEPARDFLAISGWPLLGVVIAQRANPLALVRRDSTPNLTGEATA